MTVPIGWQDGSESIMRHTCGTYLRWYIHFYGYGESALYKTMDGTAINRCPTCDSWLRWPSVAEQRAGHEYGRVAA